MVAYTAVSNPILDIVIAALNIEANTLQKNHILEGENLLQAKKILKNHIEERLNARKTQNIFTRKSAFVFTLVYEGQTIELDNHQTIERNLKIAITTHNFFEQAIALNEPLNIYLAENLDDICAEAESIYYPQ